MATKKRKEDGEAVNFRESTFRCVYCNTGAERFSEVFHEWKCVSCGGPAGVVVEISRPEDLEKIEKAVLLVYSEGDGALAHQVMEELEESGVDVIDPLVVSDNERAGNIVNVLSFLVEKTRHTLVIPSDGLSSDKLVAITVESGIGRGPNKIVSLYPDRSYMGRRLSLDAIWGVAWKGARGIQGMDWDKFVDYLKKA